MKAGQWLLFIGLLFTLIFVFPQAAQADVELPPPPAPPPLTEPLPSIASPQTSGFRASASSEAGLMLPSFTAVLVVGPIDGDTGAWTQREIANMELAAQAFIAHGVSVIRFYTPNNDWSQITAAARNAQFFIYRGHGISGWVRNGEPWVGGMALRGPGDTQLVLYSPDQVESELRLAKNAIVMLYACYTAGSGGSDADLSSAVAQNRVRQYSGSFLHIGAAGYYADWRPDSFPTLINSLFAGQTLGEAYESFYDYSPTVVERYQQPNYPALSMWLSKYRDSAGTKYHYAFAGQENATLASLFGVRDLSMYTNRVFVPVVIAPAQ